MSPTEEATSTKKGGLNFKGKKTIIIWIHSGIHDSAYMQNEKRMYKKTGKIEN